MAPPTATGTVTAAVSDSLSSLKLSPDRRIKNSGALDKYQRTTVTPVIGTEFAPGVQLVDLLEAENSDDLIRDLALLVAQRGVVFFRNQDINIDQQKELGQRLGQLSGKPATSGLHVHPLTREFSELGDEISVITSEGRAEYEQTGSGSKFASQGWHTDITFERVPSDYAILKIHTLPGESGGDTLWASGYEVYDRLSPAFKELLESKTAIHSAERFRDVAKLRGFELRTNRGAPENNDLELKAEHPVIRTNPVTGWKSVFVNSGFTKQINGVSKDESDILLPYLFKLVSENHDLQVRFKWTRNDVAIWDNRSTYHTATWDYGAETRIGDRVVSLGERPYFDQNSKSRREDLKAAAGKQ
ncbi:hypothetical protein HDV00_001412 [Rhizophlyctis rosea]|nr:hypothetical protein HDV00_001412 [Rhizophlyctis rosea]